MLNVKTIHPYGMVAEFSEPKENPTIEELFELYDQWNWQTWKFVQDRRFNPHPLPTNMVDWLPPINEESDV